MRIDAYNQIQQIYGANKIKKAEEKKSVGKSSFMDELRLSSMGIDAQLAKQALANTPDIRKDKVEPVKQQIEEGTYEVDPDDFAGKLLEKYNGLF